nr:DNA translocase FtsK [Helicobacter burdigaliensis]
MEAQNNQDDLQDIQNALSNELQEAQKALENRTQESELAQIKEAIKPQMLQAQQDLEQREQTFEEDESTFIEEKESQELYQTQATLGHMDILKEREEVRNAFNKELQSPKNSMPFFNYAKQDFKEEKEEVETSFAMPNFASFNASLPSYRQDFKEVHKSEEVAVQNAPKLEQEQVIKEAKDMQPTLSEASSIDVASPKYTKEQIQNPNAIHQITQDFMEQTEKEAPQVLKEQTPMNLQSAPMDSQNLQIPQAVLKPKALEENQALLKELTLNDESTQIENKDFILPPLDFLQTPSEERAEVDESDIDRKINDLLSKLRMFKIEGDIVRTYSGPIVTTFEFRPSPNVKVSRILTLQDDLAMALRAKTIRIQAPVPGKDVVGIEIPNQHIETIYLREILENDLFKNSTSPLTLALGKDIVGNPFVTDLKKLPHLLIAGTTGSGKSVGINAMILSLLYKNSPDTLKLIMIDPKMLEFSIYNDIPHLLTPVITQAKKAIIALDSTVKEMERRYSLMSEARTKNIEGYNQKALNEGFEPFPYIVVIIDELADLMMTGGKEAEVSISRLAQMARASGIHLIVATQRPSVDVVTGLIKANLPSRISYKVGQKIDSKVILDTFGAESLLGRGDMLFTPPGGGIVRLHAPWSSESEIEEIVEFIKSQRAPEYDETFMPSEDEALGLNYEGEVDELYEEAKRIMLNEGKTSISYLQRRLNIGYNKAANIVEQMQAKGFLSAPNSKGVREILNS